jgi:hypothetical protein
MVCFLICSIVQDHIAPHCKVDVFQVVAGPWHASPHTSLFNLSQVLSTALPAWFACVSIVASHAQGGPMCLHPVGSNGGSPRQLYMHAVELASSKRTDSELTNAGGH